MAVHLSRVLDILVSRLFEDGPHDEESLKSMHAYKQIYPSAAPGQISHVSNFQYQDATSVRLNPTQFSVDEYPHPIHLSEMFGTTTWSHLRSLSLSRVFTYGNELAAIILRHQSTLRTLCLESIFLHYDADWYDVFEVIRGMPLLEISFWNLGYGLDKIDVRGIVGGGEQGGCLTRWGPGSEEHPLCAFLFRRGEWPYSSRDLTFNPNPTAPQHADFIENIAESPTDEESSIEESEESSTEKA